jgi:CheY-like chemotaxis protein
MLSRRLQRRGYEVVLALDGREGVEKAAAERPDLVLMDMDLPVVNGWDATRMIREERETAGIPVIALTAHALVEDRERALSAGCDAYQSKPVDFAALLSKMEELLAKRVQS